LLAPCWIDAIQRAIADHDGRRRLHANAKRFRDALRSSGFDIISEAYIVPIVIGEDRPTVRAAEQLQRRGFDVRAIRPPSVPAGSARLRVSIHADHAPNVLDEFAHAIAEVIGR
ncbi:MAG: aminotransferase class I/II-fold pyridoxal phosphate-dependent enzyme, partial [Gemmataceae bacterium]|nr:aminotransferase class I/II-fold pyridoxal phosphate-dependent enzyme [Gemmataceae bacterium]